MNKNTKTFVIETKREVITTYEVEAEDGFNALWVTLWWSYSKFIDEKIWSYKKLLWEKATFKKSLLNKDTDK